MDCKAFGVFIRGGLQTRAGKSAPILIDLKVIGEEVDKLTLARNNQEVAGRRRGDTLQPAARGTPLQGQIGDCEKLLIDPYHYAHISRLCIRGPLRLLTNI